MPKLKPQKCGRCGKRLKPETWVFSRHTRSHYCRDLVACGKRAKRKSPHVRTEEGVTL